LQEEMESRWQALEARIAYRFMDRSLLAEALTHRSYANESRERGLPDNERLEFLGDAVLDLVVGHDLFVTHGHADEGELSRLRAELVSAPALASARAGCYPPARLAAVPATVLDRYFTREGGTYRLSRAVRERVSFARHDLLAAAPFPTADLILCRNVLIYFTRAEQARVVARFAAALPTNGVLVLGGTETLPIDPGLFQADLPEARNYRRTAAAVAT
jgi:hypothetical protein